MALSPLYVTATDLCEVFIDKDTGLPLAGGQIQFWVDGARTTPKLVYQLSGDPTNSQGGGYAYAALPNPITLSGTGTIQDTSGNNTSVYYYPYDALGNLELYYIVVLNANGVVQFTREAWPNIVMDDTSAQNIVSNNQVSNPQFIQVSFDTTTGLTLEVSGSGVNTYQIAPGWQLQATYSGTGTITVQQTELEGDDNYPTNPPYWLTITSTAAVTKLILIQTFELNPGLWAQTSNGNDGWLSATIALAPGSGAVMSYVPGVGDPTELLNAVNNTVTPNTFSNSVQLPLSVNTGSTISLEIDLLVNQTVSLSSVQVVTMNENAGRIPYVQDSSEKQIAQLYSYYESGLMYKPAKSYLVGWDFPLNPAQLGSSGAITGGADKSSYAWDQTIIYAAVVNSITYSREPSGALRLTAAASTSCAVIQYLPAAEARKILNNEVSVMVSAVTNNPTPLSCAVSLWYTTSAGNLPDAVVAKKSIVSSLSANGMPLTLNQPSSGSWAQVPRDSGFDALFSLTTSTSDPVTPGFNRYGFNGWNMHGSPDADAATFFAIVVGVGQLPVGQYIDINSISLVPGSIPTIPAAQSATEVLLECQRYYWQTYEPGVAPGTTTSVGMRTKSCVLNFYNPGSPTTASYAMTESFSFTYPVQMRTNPIITFYAQDSATPGRIGYRWYRGGTSSGDSRTLQGSTNCEITNWSASVGTSSAFYLNTIGQQVAITNTSFFNDVFMAYHVTVDARLGSAN